MLISQKIEQMVCNSADAQRTIGLFLLKEKQNLMHYSMQEIADETFTSKPTLVRIAKKLGFSGWNELISAYQEEIRYLSTHVSDVDVNFPFGKKDTFLEIAGKINAVKAESNEETIQMMSQDTLERVSELLAGARRICLFGISVNQFLGSLFQHKMLMAGKPVEIINQSEQGFLVETMNARDCAIVISYSGNDERRNPTSLLAGLKKHQVPIVGITSMGDNLLRQYSDEVFTIASRERLYTKISSFATESSIMLILDVLYGCCFVRNYEQNILYKTGVSRTIEQKRFSTSQGILEECE